MKRTALAITHVAVCVAIAAWLVGCQKGTLGDPDAGGSGPISGVGARGAPGIGGAGAANSGVGGAGAMGGGFGGTGQGLVDCPPPSSPVCGASCGNGRIDSCVGAIAPQCFPVALREQCDGDDVGRASCAELGYPSGKLVCDTTCSIASGIGCSECVPMVPSVVSCGTIPSLAAPNNSGYAIAATDSEVGLAEVGYNDISGVTLSFRRLTPSLDTASSTTLLDSQRPGPLAGAYVDGVAVAPMSSGWMIAGCVSGQLLLFTVDAAGVNSVRPPLRVGDGGCGYFMKLAARPGGGALLVLAAGYGVSGALIAADGQSAGAPFDIVAPSTGNAGMFDVAWVGDAFNVAVAVFVPPDYSRTLRLTRIDVNGTLTIRDVLMDEFEDMPRIARDATDTRITYVAVDEFGATDIKWRRFGSAGEPVADTLLVKATDSYSQSPAVAFGADTLVLVAAQPSLSIARIGPDGQIVTRPYDILRAPIYRIYDHEMIRRGPDAIVSWLSYDGVSARVGLARITP